MVRYFMAMKIKAALGPLTKFDPLSILIGFSGEQFMGRADFVRRIAMLAVPLIAFWATAPVAYGEPSRSEINDEVTGWLRSQAVAEQGEIILDDLKYKVFSDPTNGTGRVSAAGSWHLAADLYDLTKGKSGTSALALYLGVNEGELAYIARLTGSKVADFNGTTATRTYTAGTPIRIGVELAFVEYYDFFTFDSKVRTSLPTGVFLSPDDPALLSVAQMEEQADLIRAKYQNILDAAVGANAGTVYRASIGVFSVMIPEGGLLVHRAEEECLSATTSDGQAAVVLPPATAREWGWGWEIVKVGEDRSGEVLSIAIKATC